MEFCQSLAQKRPNIFLFKTGIEDRGQGVEGEEEDSPDHAEPAGQEGSGEGRQAVRLLVKAEMLRVWSLALMAFILYIICHVHSSQLSPCPLSLELQFKQSFKARNLFA